MTAINKHGLKMTGLKKASGDTYNYQEWDSRYNEIFYDKSDGEIIVIFHHSIGMNEWTEFKSSSIIKIVTTKRHLKMQEIADMIGRKVKGEKQ